MDDFNKKSECSLLERSDRARKFYRYASDVARRIDEALASSRSVADLFTIHTEVLRQKLKDNCEKLMFLDVTNYGKKALELVWRKVYYETIATSKKHPKGDSEANSFLYTHIMSGIGHLHCLLSRIQTEFSFPSEEIDFTYIGEHEENSHNSSNLVEVHQIALHMLHSCLIYLGDLTRYQNEIFSESNSSISARYYIQAAHIDLSSGMPYNQLGNLYLEKNYSLDSVSYYIHCLNCLQPFEGAMGNLTKVFEKNALLLESVSASENLTQSEQVQSSIVQFLSLVELWYMGKDDTDIPQRCSHIAQEIKVSLDFNEIVYPKPKDCDLFKQTLDDELAGPTYLNAGIIHKLALICLFTIAKLNETDEKKAFACKAFTLALFSQLLHKLLKSLKSMGFKNPAEKHKRSMCTSHKEEENTLQISGQNDGQKVEVNGVHEEKAIAIADAKANEENVAEKSPEKNAVKKTAKRRRRRRALSSDSSGHSEVDDNISGSSTSDSDATDSQDENISNCSEDDDSAENPTDFSDDESSEAIAKVNENGDTLQNHEPLQENKPPNGIKINGEVKIENKLANTVPIPGIEGFNEKAIQNFLQGDNILASIKVLTDWILTEKDLIISCGESGDSLFQCIVDLLNILIYHFKPDSEHLESCKVLDYARNLAKSLELEYRTIPLPEDLNLRGTNICKFDKKAAEWQILKRFRPSVYEENLIRILYFIDFGNQIAKIVPRIRLNRPMQILYLKKASPPKIHSKVPKGMHKHSREWHNSKKPQTEGGESALLHRLGRLWLASRVRELERYGRSAATPTLLALDAATLHKYLRRVKQLLKARSFVLLIPTIVLQELDDLKREESSARDAIRWLEMQLQSGSRFVRAQRSGQARPLPLLKYPRKAPPHVHNFIQILEFCHHFIGDETQGGNGDPDNTIQGKSTPLLVLLTGNDLDNSADSYKDFSITGAAKSAGITIEFIGNFYSKWKQSVPKSGKKR